MTAVYIHIPFCERKCSYCDFPSAAGKSRLYDTYAQAVRAEIASTAADLADKRVSTIYIGGGTPSCFPAPLLSSFLSTLRSCLDIPANAEISVESNPHSLSNTWLDELLAAGVNRFSLGVQSLNTKELHHLGRLHTAAEARAAFALLRNAGCLNVSVDLMYGIPDQTSASWRRTFSEVAGDWRPEHLSLYALSIEPGTPFARWKQSGAQPWRWCDDDRTMTMLWSVIDHFAACGYRHYEISNCAREGFECRHNMAYWDTAQSYIGFGAAAHSHCALESRGRTRRFHNVKRIETYIARVLEGGRHRVFARPLPPRALLGERMYMGLRLLDGIGVTEDMRSTFGGAIERLVRNGLLHERGGRIALTRRGVEIANTVFAEFV
ncbi:radical SAM family heme chaperone HemW [bacterium]|nr:radical SAM family heme chaperone HemW [bacterium]